MLTLIFLLAAIALMAAYRFYGRYIEKRFGIDDRRQTPSHTDYDGIDRVPAHKAVILGHHFSSIAGAGPIVGPIIAALAFGWLPALLWIVLGAIFIGGVHDFSSLVASIRHGARSIAEIAKLYMSPLAYKMLLAFIWLSLVYVLVVFTDLTAETFVSDGGVASSSLMFMLLAVGFGLSLNRMRLQVAAASALFVPLVFFSVWLGQVFPIPSHSIPRLIAGDPAKTWDIFLLAYCFVASTTPVWILLQPRDYLSSYLLYASVLAGFFGILCGGFAVHYPAFNAWYAPQLGALFPILFITVACGACSGFHAVVASGTSSKQLDRERDARPVAYGAMLIEGLVAVIALATVIMLPRDDALVGKPPLEVYGTGMSRFLGVFGVSPAIGFSFGLLALSTFILTTLDTATRLGRYVFEEFFNIKEPRYRYASTLATLALPAVFVLITLHDAKGAPVPAWKAIWPVFGATNQLLAGLTLLVIAVWLRKIGRGNLFVLWPMVFMIGMTVWALVLLIASYRFSAIGIIAAVLLVMAAVLVWEAFIALRRRENSPKSIVHSP
jgi:carbon starvation protein